MRKYDVTCEWMESSGLIQSLWCILKLELLMTVQHKSGMTNRTIISAAVLSRWLRSSSLALPQKIPRSHRSKRWGNRRRMSFDGQEDMSNSPASIETWARSRVFPAIDTALFFFLSSFLGVSVCWRSGESSTYRGWIVGGLGAQVYRNPHQN